ncbi:MAG: YkgJ family cysteine cluster protein [Deltaproteobacteria bacterium]|nr:YkgJ family cysteine cluster protein [Deltaproteobacteria bacterium]
MDVIPPLRDDVRLEVLPGGGHALFDGLLGRRVKLDAAGARIVTALADGADRTDTIAAATGIEPAAIDKLLSGLARLMLLATPEALDRVAVERVARAPADVVPIRVRDDARFTCTMCGGCCGGHMIGPVSDEVLAGLDTEWPALERETGSKKGLFFTLPSGDAAEVGRHVVCHASNGSCVFLTDDRKCLIHKRFGGDKKPVPCRIFPYEMVATPTGVVVTIQRECRGFLEARGGKRLADDLPDIRALLALVPARARVGTPRRRDGTPLAWADYEALEAELHTTVDDSAGDDRVVFAALGRGLGVGGVAADAASLRGDLASLRSGLDAWTGGFLEVLDLIAAEVPPPDERVLVRADGLDLLRRALRGLRADMRRVMLPLDRADQRALLRDHLHHALMGKQLVNAPSLEAGLARLAAQWALAKALAVIRAREVKRRHLVAQDLMDGLVVVSFMFRHADLAGVIQRLDGATTSLFLDRHAALVALAPELADPDERVELVKF